jgi:hypothetical protein
MTARRWHWRGANAPLLVAFGENASASDAFSPYKFPALSLRISQTHCTSALTNTNKSNIQLHIDYIYISYYTLITYIFLIAD